jgi:hypothetical protein
MVDAANYVEDVSNGTLLLEIYNDASLLTFDDSFQGVAQGIADIALVGPGAIDAVVTVNSIFTTMRKMSRRQPRHFRSFQAHISETPNSRWNGVFRSSLFGGFALASSACHCNGSHSLVPRI